MIGTIPPSACHGRLLALGTRPKPGGDPWTWWEASFASSVRLIWGIPGGDAEPDLWATTHWQRSGIEVTLHYALTPAQQREAITHEMHHLQIGGVCSSRCDRNEERVVRETARWLVPDIVDLVERLDAGPSVRHVAWDLAVPPYILRNRLDAATRGDRAKVAAAGLRLPDKLRTGVASVEEMPGAEARALAEAAREARR